MAEPPAAAAAAATAPLPSLHSTAAISSSPPSPATTTPLPSSPTSPAQRPESPSPSTSPSLALDAVPHLDRSASTPTSSISSSLSSQSLKLRRLSDGGPTSTSPSSITSSTPVRRRGYMRPQGTAFADSARNRDSVMSLGSIAHMQYYFARTGLLDGKGAQVAREKDLKKLLMLGSGGKENVEPNGSGSVISGSGSGSGSGDDSEMGSLSLHDTTAAYAVSDPGPGGDHGGFVESPTDWTEHQHRMEAWRPAGDTPMLPPTVSTYKQKPSYTEPLPDMPVLRRELKEALQDACKVLEETQKDETAAAAAAAATDDGNGNNNGSGAETNGFYEIQGLHLLDIITLAIRAAKNYYTAHTNPQKLYALKSEKDIRADLYKVLDVMKRMASRNFRGGIRPLELVEVILWIESIDQLLQKEEQREQEEAAEREAFAWREGDWTGREREREAAFLKSLDPLPSLPLPPWEPPDPANSAPTPFLAALQDGTRLVRFHNACVARSKRQFDEIRAWHADVAKPYRMAENLRFWLKAAELRWEVRLSVPVMEIVASKPDPEVWTVFDEAVLSWCRVVREELTEDWRAEKAELSRRRMPELRVSTEAESEDQEGGVGMDDEGGLSATTVRPSARVVVVEPQSLIQAQPQDGEGGVLLPRAVEG